jgi:hydrogenase maturation factor
MCITTPGRILSIDGNRAMVRINDGTVEVRIDLVDATVGDYVYCTSGMAVEKVEK